MIKEIKEIKHLISGQVDMGTFGLTCQELNKIEKEFLILNKKLKEITATEEDYKDLVIKLKSACKNQLVNEQLNNFYIIVNKL